MYLSEKCSCFSSLLPPPSPRVAVRGWTLCQVALARKGKHLLLPSLIQEGVLMKKRYATVDSFAIDFICNCSRRPPRHSPPQIRCWVAIADESTVRRVICFAQHLSLLYLSLDQGTPPLLSSSAKLSLSSSRAEEEK